LRFALITLSLIAVLVRGASAQSAPDAGATDPAAKTSSVSGSRAVPAALAPNNAAAPTAKSERAQKNEEEEEVSAPSLASRILERIQVHGFVSEGGFVSTANDYIGNSSRGSLKLFEAGINISATLTDQLRVGMQFVSRSVGTLSEEVPRLDWAIIDYRYRPWFGLRAGVIKVPLGLYNESIGIDAARTAILLPQSVYPLRNRDALISHTGFALYGDVPLGLLGGLDYQVWLGILTIPRSALELDGAQLNSVDTKYVTGGQLFWRPIEGLRMGATYLRSSIDFHLTLDNNNTQQLIAAGAVPPDYNGKLLVQQRPATFWVASAEYVFGDALFAFEYSRWLKHQQTSLPVVLPSFDEDAERFYGMATYRLSPHFELGTYYSVTHADVHDRRGDGERFMGKRSTAFQRDLAGTLRIDINDYWLWKVEAHLIDGVAELQSSQNPNPTRLWGLFLFRTTVTF
jgi:hypothetical protein